MQENKIIIDNVTEVKLEEIPTNIKVKFSGRGNTIKLDSQIFKNNLFNLNINFIRDNSIFFIDDSINPINLNIIIGANSKVIIGKNFQCWGAKIHVWSKNVVIGDDNLFAENITFLPSDAHYIYDKNSKQIINSPGDIVIGNHNWLARNVTFLKGSSILNDTVVGFGAIVTKKFTESNVILAGNPAVIIKRNIMWKK